jgi:nicotinate-nucleotide adenylyltransferase
VDTLRALRAEVGPGQPWAILVGADSFRMLDSWSRWRELFDLAHVVVAARAGSALEELSRPVSEVVAGRWAHSPQELHAAAAGRVFILDQPIFPQSASALRARIAAGEPWRDWVPGAVAGYIDRHGLYQ